MGMITVRSFEKGTKSVRCFKRYSPYATLVEQQATRIKISLRFRLARGGSRFYIRGMHVQEAIEWPDEVETLVDRIESESSERDLSREERALMDIYETVPILTSQDCLHEFWQSGINHQRVINSFELIGATSLVDPINASRWCETRTEDRNDYTETESSYLSSIEEELSEGMEELVELVQYFIEEEME